MGSTVKLRTATPASVSFFGKSLIILVVITMAFIAPLQPVQQVAADQYDDKINALQQDIDKYQAQAATLNAQASSLAAALSQLANERLTLQAQINLNQAQYDQLVVRIAGTEKKIKENRDALGVTIANLYVDQKISPLEMVASSKNISEYLDKQEYRNSVRDSLTATITEINKLKTELDTQKLQAERVLSDQKSQSNVLAQKVAEQEKLVRDTKGQEAAFSQLASASLAQKQKVQQEQQASLAAAVRATGGGILLPGDPSLGGYPSRYANVGYYAYVVDQWGMYARQCVSYTAWKVFQKNGYMPYWGGFGNANQWPANARASNIPTGNSPRVGSVGVIMAGSVGHVAWVEAVNSNGTIDVSQYNYEVGTGPGMFSRMRVSPQTFDIYIYF